MAGSETSNPYVGPRPFSREEAGLFFGRGAEADELLSLVIANQVVLLYAASGAGKTSLLNAALIPALELEGFDVLPVARLRGSAFTGPPSPSSNAYVCGLLSNWYPNESPSRRDAEIHGLVSPEPHAEPALRIVEYLAALERPVDADGSPAPRAVVVDQFEELFFLHPERWQERDGLFLQLAEALENDPFLRLVISLREDYLAQLDRYARLLPGRLRMRLPLEPLRREAALDAVIGPLRGTPVTFAPGAAEAVVDNLLRVRVETGGGTWIEVPGEYVDPVQLQVVCQSLFRELPPRERVIGVEHVKLVGNVDAALLRLYDEAIAAAVKATRAKEKDLRTRFESGFITPAGTRAIVYRGASSTAGLPNAAVDVLEWRHVVRKEFRSGAVWYELTHDRLIGPILASNRRHGVSEPSVRVGRRVGTASVLSSLAEAINRRLRLRRGRGHGS